MSSPPPAPLPERWVRFQEKLVAAVAEGTASQFRPFVQLVRERGKDEDKAWLRRVMEHVGLLRNRERIVTEAKSENIRCTSLRGFVHDGRASCYADSTLVSLWLADPPLDIVRRFRAAAIASGDLFSQELIRAARFLENQRDDEEATVAHRPRRDLRTFLAELQRVAPPRPRINYANGRPQSATDFFHALGDVLLSAGNVTPVRRVERVFVRGDPVLASLLTCAPDDDDRVVLTLATSRWDEDGITVDDTTHVDPEVCAELAAGHELRVRRCTFEGGFADHYEIVGPPDHVSTLVCPIVPGAEEVDIGAQLEPKLLLRTDQIDGYSGATLLRVEEIQPLPHAQTLVAEVCRSTPGSTELHEFDTNFGHDPENVGDWRIGPDSEWSLRACVARLGSTHAAGHYIAVLKRGDDWFAYDDTTFSGYLVQNLESREATVESVEGILRDHGELFIYERAVQ